MNWNLRSNTHVFRAKDHLGPNINCKSFQNTLQVLELMKWKEMINIYLMDPIFIYHLRLWEGKWEALWQNLEIITTETALKLSRIPRTFLFLINFSDFPDNFGFFWSIFISRCQILSDIIKCSKFIQARQNFG